jgi:hypothetical protein
MLSGLLHRHREHAVWGEGRGQCKFYSSQESYQNDHNWAVNYQLTDVERGMTVNLLMRERGGGGALYSVHTSRMVSLHFILSGSVVPIIRARSLESLMGGT